MRVWSFTFANEEEYNVAGAKFVEIFKDSEDYKNKKIIIAGAQDKDKTYKVFLSIDDVVPGSFITSISNAFEKNLKNAFSVIKSNCKDATVDLPVDCKILCWYEEEKNNG